MLKPNSYFVYYGPKGLFTNILNQNINGSISSSPKKAKTRPANHSPPNLILYCNHLHERSTLKRGHDPLSKQEHSHVMYMWVVSDPNQTQTQNKPK